jgi:hypothetical protein
MEGSVGITVLCPTRGNPAALLEAYNSYRDTVMERASRFVAVVDADDPLMESYVSLTEDSVDLRVDVVPKDKAGSMNAALNFAAMRWVDRSSVLGFIGDDHRFRTKGWDRVIGQVMEDRSNGFVYGDDLYMGEKLPTAVFISSRIVRALGWFGPPKCKHLYLDNTWKDLGEATNSLVYLPDIIIEHMHPIAGKGEWDENHLRVNVPAMYDHDREAYNWWVASMRSVDIEVVNRAMV